MVIPLPLKWLLPILALSSTSASDGAVGLCEHEEDDLGSTSMFTLLQMHMQLTSTGHAGNSSVSAESSPSQLTLGADRGRNNLALCFICPLVCLVLMMCLVKMSSPITQASAWSVLNKVMVAFVASLFVTCLRDTTDYVCGDFAQRHQPLLPFLRFKILFCLVKSFLHFYMEEDSLIATGTLGSFVVGFAAIDLFDAVLRLDAARVTGMKLPESHSVLFWTLISTGTLLVAAVLLTVQRRMSQVADDKIQQQRWLEQSEEVDDEAFSLTIGFLACQVASFTLTAELYSINQLPLLAEAAIPRQPFAVVTIIYMLWLVIGCNVWSLEKVKPHSRIHRAEFSIVRTLSMFLTWCVLRWGELVFLSLQERWFPDSYPVSASLLSALVLSAGGLLLVLFATSIFKESKEDGVPHFHMFSGSLGLLIGQTWMICFYRASAGLGSATEGGFSKLSLVQRAVHSPNHSERAGSCLQTIMFIALILVVCPAWKGWILPRMARRDFSNKDARAMPTPAIDALLASKY